MDNQRPQIGQMILEKKQVDDEVRAALNEALGDFKAKFMESMKK